MPIHDLLQSLPSVVCRRLNNRDGFFTAGRMFALVSDTNLWLRLPTPATTALLEAERGLPVVAAPVPNALCWVSMPLANPDPAELHQLALTSHQAVRAASRQVRRSRAPARRRNRTPA
jgi:hypothetical protein